MLRFTKSVQRCQGWAMKMTTMSSMTERSNQADGFLHCIAWRVPTSYCLFNTPRDIFSWRCGVRLITTRSWTSIVDAMFVPLRCRQTVRKLRSPPSSINGHPFATPQPWNILRQGNQWRGRLACIIWAHQRPQQVGWDKDACEHNFLYLKCAAHIWFNMHKETEKLVCVQVEAKWLVWPINWTTAGSETRARVNSWVGHGILRCVYSGHVSPVLQCWWRHAGGRQGRACVKKHSPWCLQLAPL